MDLLLYLSSQTEHPGYFLGFILRIVRIKLNFHAKTPKINRHAPLETERRVISPLTVFPPYIRVAQGLPDHAAKLTVTSKSIFKQVPMQISSLD